MKSSSGNGDHLFRFVTNHAHVLQVIAADPSARLRDIAQTVGVTERTAAHIVNDLERSGYVSKSRNGRRNHDVADGPLFVTSAPELRSAAGYRARRRGDHPRGRWCNR